MSITAQSGSDRIGEAEYVPAVVEMNIPASQPQSKLYRAAEISSPSLDDLIDAHLEEYRPRFEVLRASFEVSQAARIEEQYFTHGTHAAAVLLCEDATTEPRTPMPKTGVRRIKFSYDSGIVNPKYDELMRALHSEQLQSSNLLEGVPQHIVVQRIYAVITNLLSVLDSCRKGQATLSVAECDARLRAAVDSGWTELESIRDFARRSTHRQALGRYLFGFPAGILVAVLAVVGVANMRFTVGHNVGNGVLAVCLGAGAIGAVVSVMARITGGQQLDINSDQSKLITVLAGAFRPLVGAVFGAVLYTLILGGLLPLAVPGNGGPPAADIGFFFAAIAFLAGFSERWAQDTIVQSTPKINRRSKNGAPKPKE